MGMSLVVGSFITGTGGREHRKGASEPCQPSVQWELQSLPQVWEGISVLMEPSPGRGRTTGLSPQPVKFPRGSRHPVPLRREGSCCTAQSDGFPHGPAASRRQLIGSVCLGASALHSPRLFDPEPLSSSSFQRTKARCLSQQVLLSGRAQDGLQLSHRGPPPRRAGCCAPGCRVCRE